MKVLHIPCFSLSDPLPVLQENVGKLKAYSSVGLIATAQHLNKIDGVARFLEEKGKRVLVGGQVLGCSQHAALRIQDKVECFLYIGSGRFHPIGVALKTAKPVFVLNSISRVFDLIKDEERESWQRKQKARISRAAAAETFGILVSTKDGQFNLKKAEDLKKKIKAKGRKAFIFTGGELSPENLLPFKVDCWINTACPRITDDEHSKPVLNPEELEYLNL